MHTLFAVAAILFLPLFAQAQANGPVAGEVFNITVDPWANRCLQDPNGIDHCAKPKELSKQTIQLALDKCDNENAFGPRCSGTFKQEVKVDMYSYLFRIDVSHFQNPNFKYQISLWVCRGGYQGACARNTFYLQDEKVPAFWLSGPALSKGRVGKNRLWYNAGMAIGEQPPM